MSARRVLCELQGRRINRRRGNAPETSSKIRSRQTLVIRRASIVAGEYRGQKTASVVVAPGVGSRSAGNAEKPRSRFLNAVISDLRPGHDDAVRSDSHSIQKPVARVVPIIANDLFSRGRCDLALIRAHGIAVIGVEQDGRTRAAHEGSLDLRHVAHRVVVECDGRRPAVRRPEAGISRHGPRAALAVDGPCVILTVFVDQCSAAVARLRRFSRVAVEIEVRIFEDCIIVGPADDATGIVVVDLVEDRACRSGDLGDLSFGVVDEGAQAVLSIGDRFHAPPLPYDGFRRPVLERSDEGTTDQIVRRLRDFVGGIGVTGQCARGVILEPVRGAIREIFLRH